MPTFQVEKYVPEKINQIENSDWKKIVHFYGNDTKVKNSFVIKPPVLDFRKQFIFVIHLRPYETRNLTFSGMIDTPYFFVLND